MSTPGIRKGTSFMGEVPDGSTPEPRQRRTPASVRFGRCVWVLSFWANLEEGFTQDDNKSKTKLRFFARVQAYGILLGGVNSDYSQLADVANQERIREYDYGPGLGGAVELYLQRKNLPLLTARYRYSYLNVPNGSIYTGETASGAAIGLDSDHDVHQIVLAR